jgi:glutamyl/glutaminyl-tRNA synthetase
MLRVDDLDTYRVREEYVQFIFEALPFFGISWQIGPRSIAELEDHWSQRHRLQQYENCIERLQKGGHLFACACSRKQMRSSDASSGCVGDCKQTSLQDPELPHALRLNTKGDPQSFSTLDVHESTLPPDPEMNDFVVRRKDGLPAYQIASLVDDLHFGPWGIVRGSDLLPSTWAQLQLASLLKEQAFARIHFVHHGLINRAEDELSNEKLSKSHAAPALQLTSSARSELMEEYLGWKRKEKAAAYLDRSRGSMRA